MQAANASTAGSTSVSAEDPQPRMPPCRGVVVAAEAAVEEAVALMATAAALAPRCSGTAPAFRAAVVPTAGAAGTATPCEADAGGETTTTTGWEGDGAAGGRVVVGAGVVLAVGAELFMVDEQPAEPRRMKFFGSNPSNQAYPAKKKKQFAKDGQCGGVVYVRGEVAGEGVGVV